MRYICDEYGFAWSDALETLEEAQRYFHELEKEPIFLSDGTKIKFEIERRD